MLVTPQNEVARAYSRTESQRDRSIAPHPLLHYHHHHLLHVRAVQIKSTSKDLRAHSSPQRTCWSPFPGARGCARGPEPAF